MREAQNSLDAFRKLAKENAKPKKNKYHAEKVNGYASKKEYYRANELKLLQRSGNISNLREQVPFELIGVQRDANGKVIERACSYLADFVYNEKDDMIVEDTKGFRTAEYKIKRKLMLSVHGIKIREI